MDVISFQKELKQLLYPFVTSSNDNNISSYYSHPVTDCESYLDTLNLRLKYMDISVLFKLVLHCLSYQSTNEKYTSSSENQKIIKDLYQTVSYLEVENYIRISKDASKLNGLYSPPISSGTLFNIDCNQVEEKTKLLLIPQHFQLFKKLMENFLKIEYFNIIGFTFPGVEFQSCEEGISSIIGHVEKLKKDKNSKQILLYQQQEYNSSLLFMVFNQCTEYGNNLKSSIMAHRFCENPVLYLNYKIVSMKAYLLKLRCMELEILCNTYTCKSIPALKTLHEKMILKRGITENKLLFVEHKLSAYSDLDPKFKDLLREFSSLQKDIKSFILI